jgi:ribosome maturation factor RimP
MGTDDAVRRLVEPLLAARGLELFDVEVRNNVLRISVDKTAGGDLDLDTISQASEVISAALDEHDPIPGKYTLEVSSPGLERPLRTPVHFRRFVGTTVSVRTQPGVEGERRLQGTLEAADDDGITLVGRRLAYSEIERARTVFEWGPTPKRAAATPRSKKNKKAS